ncbi:MAG: hypothetical protein KKB51_20365 [Candidatus Riflebacteria bacterium]|nr:hypothetical protein [Candidatus Riflebacteria bacterium]
MFTTVFADRLWRSAFLLLFISASQLYAIEIGCIDSRACMLSHPAFQKFDWQSRRFFDTISAPVSDFAAEYENLKKLEKNASDSLRTIEKDIGKAFASSEKQNGALWAKRNQVVAELDYIKQRREILQHLQDVETLVPETETVWCTLHGVEKDVANAFDMMKQKYRIDVLMDSAALSPVAHPPEPQMHVLCAKTLNSFIEAPDSIDTDEFVAWLANSRYYWQRKIPEPCNNPFKFGVKDYTGVACSNIKNISGIRTADEGDKKVEE